MKKPIFVLCFSIFASLMFAKNNLHFSPDTSKTLPKVFLLGEYTSAYEKLQNSHPVSLFEYCSFDQDQAFDKWARFLIAMEMHAESINYDLKGIKVWIEVGWEKDGKLKFIAFAPKPECRNVDVQELSGFFRSFSNHYTPQFIPSKTIVQNSQAAFPFLTR
jgi:hypothetical protein